MLPPIEGGQAFGCWLLAAAEGLSGAPALERAAAIAAEAGLVPAVAFLKAAALVIRGRAAQAVVERLSS